MPAATPSVLGLSSPDNTTISATSGVYSLKATANNTVVGFNSSGVYTGFTLGTGLAFSGSQIVATGSGGITGTLTSPCIPVATGTSTVACSLLSDNGTTLSYTGQAFAISSTLPGSVKITGGTGSIPALNANMGGFAAPNPGGTSYLFKLPQTASQGFILSGTPSLGDNVNEAAWSFAHMEYAITSGWTNIGTIGAGVVISSYQPLNAGHFVNLNVNYGGSSCTTAPFFNVFDGATNVGTAVQGSNAYQAPGTATNQVQTLAFSAGDNIGIKISTTGVSCTGFYVVTATVQYLRGGGK